eukprot:CAMPEP_0198150442 /NCGR_PEP_ID=MMETSP1443-20131203/50956_1 /TAXON_ID=186043 /ORGANISM="Entomoneis sp., Strain CCMP2396" /LENGTH=238 /DNA_ID=CAMNT_0043815741 /DNA_START=292 /DNA_END=1008 /DNA_ORIENTATION=+
MANPIVKGPELPPLATNAKRLFLVRHGEVINPGGDRAVYYGAQDVSLSPLGEQEATAAGTYLNQFPLSHVFCSPLKRAVFGAEQVLEQQQTQNNSLKSPNVIIYDGFKELDRGDWCGKTNDEIGADQMDLFDACDESVIPKNGESYPALKERVLNDLAKVLEEHMEEGDMAAIVSHLQVTRCMLSEATGIPTSKMVGIKVATASVTCIDYENNGQPKIVHFQSFKPNVGLEVAKDGAN